MHLNSLKINLELTLLVNLAKKGLNLFLSFKVAHKSECSKIKSLENKRVESLFSAIK